MTDFISSRWTDILFNSYQHASLVVQALIVATVVALLIAVVVTRFRGLAPVANAVSAVGLTIPSLALLGLVIPLVGIGTLPSIFIVVFFAILPILRNAVVGLQQVPSDLIEAARGQGMSSASILLRVRLPLAWPVIMTGIRVSTQMSMGVAAIAAYALGPGLGSYIFRGLSQIGSENALYYTLVGTIGVIIVALVLDAVLVLLGRLTASKGIRS